MGGQFRHPRDRGRDREGGGRVEAPGPDRDRERTRNWGGGQEPQRPRAPDPPPQRPAFPPHIHSDDLYMGGGGGEGRARAWEPMSERLDARREGIPQQEARPASFPAYHAPFPAYHAPFAAYHAWFPAYHASSSEHARLALPPPSPPPRLDPPHPSHPLHGAPNHGVEHVRRGGWEGERGRVWDDPSQGSGAREMVRKGREGEERSGPAPQFREEARVDARCPGGGGRGGGRGGEGVEERGDSERKRRAASGFCGRGQLQLSDGGKGNRSQGVGSKANFGGGQPSAAFLTGVIKSCTGVEPRNPQPLSPHRNSALLTRKP